MSQDKEFGSVPAHLNDTFDVLWAEHAEIPPNQHAFFGQDDGTGHEHGALLLHNL